MKSRFRTPTNDEIRSLVFRLMEEGKRPKQISVELKEEFEKRNWDPEKAWGREPISLALGDAIEAGQLVLRPELDESLAKKISEEFIAQDRDRDPLQCTVAAAESAEQMAEAALQELEGIISDLVRSQRRVGDESGTIRIGWAGGRTPSKLVSKFLDSMHQRRLLTKRAKRARNDPKRIVIHSIVGELGHSNPEFNPNNYFSKTHSTEYGRGHGDDYVKTEFFGLPLPGVLELPAGTGSSEEKLKAYIEDLRQQSPMVRLAYDQKKDIDLIVCSCGHWGRTHRSLCDHVEDTGVIEDKTFAGKWKRYHEYMKKVGCVGDIMWQPVSETGLLHDEQIWISTLFQLDELTKFIRDGKHVLLLMGPCSSQDCGDSKYELLRALINCPGQLATNLVVDRRTAMDFFASASVRSANG